MNRETVILIYRCRKSLLFLTSLVKFGVLGRSSSDPSNGGAARGIPTDIPLTADWLCVCVFPLHCRHHCPTASSLLFHPAAGAGSQSGRSVSSLSKSSTHLHHSPIKQNCRQEMVHVPLTPYRSRVTFPALFFSWPRNVPLFCLLN